MRFLREIQSKPSDAKARYAAAGASVVTGLIALIWVTTLPSRFASITPVENGANETNGTRELKELFDETKSQLGSVINWQETIEELGRETTNLDALSAPDDVSEETVEEESFLPEAEAPSSEESGDETPRVVLIGTTTPPEAD